MQTPEQSALLYAAAAQQQAAFLQAQAHAHAQANAQAQAAQVQVNGHNVTESIGAFVAQPAMSSMPTAMPLQNWCSTTGINGLSASIQGLGTMPGMAGLAGMAGLTGAGFVSSQNHQLALAIPGPGGHDTREVSSDTPRKRELVDKVKRLQRSSELKKQQWYTFCHVQGSEQGWNYDPSRHTEETLERFFQLLDSPTLRVGPEKEVGEDESKELCVQMVLQVQQMGFQESWGAFCMWFKMSSDPQVENYDVEFLRCFLNCIVAAQLPPDEKEGEVRSDSKAAIIWKVKEVQKNGFREHWMAFCQMFKWSKDYDPSRHQEKFMQMFLTAMAYLSPIVGITLPSISEHHQGEWQWSDVDINETLFVGGLPREATEDALWSHFADFGTVEEVTLKYDDSGSFRGFGFVRFTAVESARAVLARGEGNVFQGKRMNCQPAAGKGATKGKAKGRGKYDCIAKGANDWGGGKSGWCGKDSSWVWGPEWSTWNSSQGEWSNWAPSPSNAWCGSSSWGSTWLPGSDWDASFSGNCQGMSVSTGKTTAKGKSSVPCAIKGKGCDDWQAGGKDVKACKATMAKAMKATMKGYGFEASPKGCAIASGMPGSASEAVGVMSNSFAFDASQACPQAAGSGVECGAPGESDPANTGLTAGGSALFTVGSNLDINTTYGATVYGKANSAHGGYTGYSDIEGYTPY